MDRAAFGPELRRARQAAGLSLSQLSAKIHYSKSQLSKIENGLQRPTIAFARRCDDLLGLGSVLVDTTDAVVDHPAGKPFEFPSGADWILHLRANGSAGFASGAHEIVELMPPGGARVGVDLAVLEAHLDVSQRLARAASPTVVLPIVIGQLHGIRAMMRHGTREPERSLLKLGSRFAETIGWLVQETGDHRQGIRWTEYAIAAAEAAGDTELADYARVRCSLMMVYHGEPGRAIATSDALRNSSDVSVRVRWLAAHRAAQGYAIVGDASRCHAAIDAARELEPGLVGSSALSPTAAAATTAIADGWCCYDLGRVDESVDILDREVPFYGMHSARARARFGVRRALAHAEQGDVRGACDIVDELIIDIHDVDSATIRLDLRTFARTVGRRRNHQSVNQLLSRLSASLLGRAYS